MGTRQTVRGRLEREWLPRTTFRKSSHLSSPCLPGVDFLKPGKDAPPSESTFTKYLLCVSSVRKEGRPGYKELGT